MKYKVGDLLRYTELPWVQQPTREEIKTIEKNQRQTFLVVKVSRDGRLYSLLKSEDGKNLDYGKYHVEQYFEKIS